MNKGIHGVITGDIVGSTKLDREYRAILEGIAEDIVRYKMPKFRLEFYRGDGFQSIITHPEEGLTIMLLLKSGLRRHPLKAASNRVEDAIDARLSLGIGEISGTLTREKPLGQMDGSAFIRSGRSLEKMKEDKSMLKITTGVEEFDKEFEAVCYLLDAITSKWSINQAQAIYFYLLQNLTQKEIGKQLGISQRGAGKRLITASIEEVMIYNSRFKSLMQWKYSS